MSRLAESADLGPKLTRRVGTVDTIEWEISLYVGRPLPLICPITSDQSFDLSARAKCCEDKKEMAGNMGVGWPQLLAADETFTAIIVASDPPSFVQPGLLTPGLCY